MAAMPARFAAASGDPNHLYLGTANSWIYESTDGGGSWHRLARLDTADDLVVDHILVDPGNPSLIYAAAWKFGRPDGGLWISHDGGKTWKANPGMQGQSIRAFAQAPSDPKILFAGTLQGVFRSRDAGGSWEQISPTGSREIHEVESLAVDPKDPDIVYAGTWHLPWKTPDGGNYWVNIKQGVIDDSDVFSIIVDPRPAEHRLCECLQRHLQKLRMPAPFSKRSRESRQLRVARAYFARTPCTATRSMQEPPKASTRPPMAERVSSA